PHRSRDYLSAIGADEIIDRATLDLGSKPLETARWGGAINNLGGATLTWLTRTVQPYGNIVSIGLAQSHELNTTVMPFILRGVSLLGIHS
ncbi:UNVERIFIED_CONTAM: oxidoreductase, partial [Salmonella enterica subsp. enterica serovar Weltevreden]